jgi:tetratricopeptide (TPR) repeat protein
VQRESSTPDISDRQPEGLPLTLPICVLLVGLVGIVFGQTLRFDFVNFDDDQYVYENPQVMNGLSLSGIRWAFTHVHGGNWHPLTTISHMLDCQLFGLQPWGHHLTNVLLHAGATVLLFIALWQLTGARWPSAFVAAVFAIHPLRISSVAWIAERKDVLSGVFFMLTIYAYGRYAKLRRFSRGQYATVLVFFALGLLCKPTLVTLPFVLLLLDYWPLRRFGERTTRFLVLEKLPFFVLSAASCVATLIAQKEAVAKMSPLPAAARIGNACVSYAVYLGQMIWPFGLSAQYPYPQNGVPLSAVLSGLLLLLTITAAAFFYRRRYPFILVGWLWFLGVLVPMIGIIQVGGQARADRYTYLAQIGLYILLTWGAMELVTRWRRGREVSIVIATLIVVALTLISYAQTTFWQNSETLWNQALANTKDNYLAHNNLGNALKQKGRLDEAIVHYQKSLESCTDFPEVYRNLGHTFAAKGNWPEAIKAYRSAIEAWPWPDAHNNNNLAIALARSGKADEALAQFEEALRLDPGFSEAHYNLAVLLVKQLGRPDEGVIHLKEVIRLDPHDEQAKAQLRAMGVEL